MQRITYEQIDENGNVTSKRVWEVPPEGDVQFSETCPVQHRYQVGCGIPYGTERGPTMLHLTAVLDPRVRWESYRAE